MSEDRWKHFGGEPGRELAENLGLNRADSDCPYCFVDDVGLAVFENSRDLFNEWMWTANTALGGKTPFDYMVDDDDNGPNEVIALLGRIKHGTIS